MVPNDNWSQFRIANTLLSANTSKNGIMKLKVLNITHMTGQRKDGHSSVYYIGPGVGSTRPRRQDCSHWCLPGVPDVWNELLYALVLKHDEAS